MPVQVEKIFPNETLCIRVFQENDQFIYSSFAKKKAQLRIKSQLGSFVCNSRDAGKEAERILEDYLKLKKKVSTGYLMTQTTLFVIEE